MSTVGYLVSVSDRRAIPIVLSNRGSAIEMTLVGGPQAGAIPVYIGNLRDPGVMEVRLVGSSQEYTSFSYLSKVLDAGVGSFVAYWPMNEQEPNLLLDASGFGRNGTYTNVAFGASGIRDGGLAPTFNGSSSFANVQSAALASGFSGPEGTLSFWAKMRNASVWSDGLVRYMCIFLADASNNIQARKNSGANSMQLVYTAGGTASAVVITFSGTDWFHCALTWSKSRDQVRGYLNGVQQGATQTGLGTFAGTLATSVIGAQTLVPANVHDGQLAHLMLANQAYDAAQIAALASFLPA